jgi:hypothetical protein
MWGGAAMPYGYDARSGRRHREAALARAPTNTPAVPTSTAPSRPRPMAGVARVVARVARPPSYRLPAIRRLFLTQRALLI